MFTLSPTVVPFGVYVHWPFCLSKCPYCDFNSHVRDKVDQARWRAALLAEIEHAAASGPQRPVTSIFFGGGTPSLMPPETTTAVIEKIRDCWGFAPDVEITTEANPTSVEIENFKALADAGVNRLSIGVQSFDNTVLEFLGREHSGAEAIAAIEIAAAHFGRYSFDLIYARPDQTLADWHRELDRALSLAGSHLSLYQLTIERGTPFHGLWRQGKLTPLDEDLAAEMFTETRAWLTDAGLPAYEISNHGAPGSECRHNLLYWRYQDYVGIGPGAHGRVTIDETKFATERRKLPERWLEAVERDGHGTRDQVALSIEDKLVELVIMGLRTAEGIPDARFQEVAGASFKTLLNTDALHAFTEEGLIHDDATCVRATEAGQLHLDTLIERLLP
ncbi:MAG: radical SAM family heme chaperone HemW [Alphaproteobacteria bacterium]